MKKNEKKLSCLEPRPEVLEWVLRVVLPAVACQSTYCNTFLQFKRTLLKYRRNFFGVNFVLVLSIPPPLFRYTKQKQPSPSSFRNATTAK